jgi:transposase
MPYRQQDRQITVGVDTHKDTHVAVALDQVGARLGQIHVPADLSGYDQLEAWAGGWGRVSAFGVEGTGSYGAGLARYLRRAGHRVVEVNRADRSVRRRKGKSDPVDAEMAARAVLSGQATATPKAGEGTAEMLRTLKMVKDSAVKARTQAVNQIKAIVITAPATLRQELSTMDTTVLLHHCAAYIPQPLTTPEDAARHALALLAQRALALLEQTQTVKIQLEVLAAQAAPALLDVYGCGPDSAATLLAAAGDNPHRLHSEAAFAALCGTNPIPASSGKTQRMRLNRGGNRQANAALHRIAIVRLRWHQPTRDYRDRRRKEGKTTTEILRCLKRYIAREIYKLLCQPAPATT